MDDSLPLTIGQRYRVIAELGHGGMGVVYLVEHVHTGQRWALKLLDAQLAERSGVRERFHLEMQVPRMIGSDHVVQITDAALAPELGDVPYLVMEYLEGCDLNKLLEPGPLDRSEVVWVLTQVGRALDRAHGAKLIHRDLKPQNLFLQRRADGGLFVKVLDFGIAKLMMKDPFEARVYKTRAGEIVGTPAYMAPEQLPGQTDRIGVGTDVWAIGLLAFRMLTDHSYWGNLTIGALLNTLGRGVHDPPSQRGASFGPAFDAWFLRSCALDPAARWPSAGEQIVALRVALGVSREDKAPTTLQRRLAKLAPPEGQATRGFTGQVELPRDKPTQAKEKAKEKPKAPEAAAPPNEAADPRQRPPVVPPPPPSNPLPPQAVPQPVPTYSPTAPTVRTPQPLLDLPEPPPPLEGDAPHPLLVAKVVFALLLVGLLLIAVIGLLTRPAAPVNLPGSGTYVETSEDSAAPVVLPGSAPSVGASVNGAAPARDASVSAAEPVRDLAQPPPPRPDLAPAVAPPRVPPKELKVRFRAERPLNALVSCAAAGQKRTGRFYGDGEITMQAGWTCEATMAGFAARTYSFAALWRYARDGVVTVRIKLTEEPASAR